MSTEPLANVVDISTKTEEQATPLAKSTREVYRLVRDSIELVGGAECAAKIMGVDRGDLRRALDRSGRYLAVEHVMAFSERLVQYSPETAQRIAAAVVRPSDMLVYPRIQLTAAERARRLENLMRSMPLGDELVRKALETP